MWNDYDPASLGGWLTRGPWQLHLVLSPRGLHGAFWRCGWDGGTWLVRVGCG